jgi:hypothetical protein
MKTPAFERWISLDSLVRIVTYQWVTRGFHKKIFLGASWQLKPPDLAPTLDAMRKGGLLIGQA